MFICQICEPDHPMGYGYSTAACATHATHAQTRAAGHTGSLTADGRCIAGWKRCDACYDERTPDEWYEAS